jgi:hypothetical protein
MRRRLFVAVVVLLGALAAGCGDDPEVQSVAPPPTVPDAVVPGALPDNIALYENTDEETLEAFAAGGSSSLVADGRLWELRQGARLVGALQVSTVMTRVDLADRGQRTSMLRQVLPGNLNQLVVDRVPVWAAEANDKVVYVWFATGTFQVLQLKGSTLDSEAILREIVAHQLAAEDWLPLPPEAYEDEV